MDFVSPSPAMDFAATSAVMDIANPSFAAFDILDGWRWPERGSWGMPSIAPTSVQVSYSRGEKIYTDSDYHYPLLFVKTNQIETINNQIKNILPKKKLSSN